MLLLRCLIENVWFEVTIIEISACFHWYANAKTIGFLSLLELCFCKSY